MGEACLKFVSGLKLFSHGPNLGDARSLVIHSASTTHSQLTADQLTADQQIAAGAAPDVARLSIGIEDSKDLIADLGQVLKAATVECDAGRCARCHGLLARGRVEEIVRQGSRLRRRSS